MTMPPKKRTAAILCPAICAGLVSTGQMRLSINAGSFCRKYIVITSVGTQNASQYSHPFQKHRLPAEKKIAPKTIAKKAKADKYVKA